jgi:hypothetical protein
MKFVFIPKAQYRIGQVIHVQGRRAQVVAYAHTGRNVEVATLEGKPERILCICTDNEPIEGVTR